MATDPPNCTSAFRSSTGRARLLRTANCTMISFCPTALQLHSTAKGSTMGTCSSAVTCLSTFET